MASFQEVFGCRGAAEEGAGGGGGGETPAGEEGGAALRQTFKGIEEDVGHEIYENGCVFGAVWAKID